MSRLTIGPKRPGHPVQTLSALFLAASVLSAPMAFRAAAQPAAPRGNVEFRPVTPPVEPVTDLNTPIVLDPAVRTGTLPNGMTYFIRRNGWPEKRVSFRLAVNAGSILEDDDQQGMAHFLEHMVFNGSGHFKPGELVKFMESIGARFGPHVNAYTSFDETVYMLDLASDQDSLLTRGLDAISDYAGRATLTDTEIDKERGVVLDEWRRGLGAMRRIRDRQFPVIFHGSRYADRLPIGQPEIVEKGSADRIRAFYRKWYRPDYMAIVAVGDFDPGAMEQKIRAAFQDIPNPAAPLVRPEFDVPPHAETLVTIATDREASYSGAQVYFKRPHEPTTTLADYRKGLVDGLVFRMLAQRFQEVSQRPDAPFLGASAGGGGMARSLETFRLFVRTEDGRIAPGLSAAVAEIKRAVEFGFLAGELQRARDDYLSSVQQAYNERTRTENADLASEYVAWFLDREPSPGIEFEYQESNRLAPTISLDEVNAALKRMITPDNRVIAVSAPDKEGLTPPAEPAIRAAFDQGWAAAVTPWIDTVADRPLMAELPAPGTVTARREVPEIGVTVLTLSNGAEIWLKPTDFQNDEILFSASSLGGASIADPADYPAVARAAAIIGEQGIGGFKPAELEKLLSGKVVNGHPFIGNYTHGLGGDCAPRDLETALQLLYLTMTQPTDRPEAFEVLRKRWRNEAENRANDPNAVFSERVARLNSGDSYMARPLTPADVDGLDMTKAVGFYRQRYANAADFTFFFVGRFDPATLEPLVARYIGGLPSTGKKTAAFVDRGLRFPAKVVTEEVTKGLAPKSQTQWTFFADTGLDEMPIYHARMAANILRRRLRETLREELGTTYSVSAGYGNVAPLKGYGTVSVAYSGAPEKAALMADTTLAVITRLRAAGPTAEEVTSLQEQERRELETSEKQNGYWLGSLQTVNMLGYDPVRIARRRERIESLNRDVLHQAFLKYFPLDRYTRVTLMPEAGSAGGDGAPAR